MRERLNKMGQLTYEKQTYPFHYWYYFLIIIYLGHSNITGNFYIPDEPYFKKQSYVKSLFEEKFNLLLFRGPGFFLCKGPYVM